RTRQLGETQGPAIQGTEVSRGYGGRAAGRQGGPGSRGEQRSAGHGQGTSKGAGTCGDRHGAAGDGQRRAGGSGDTLDLDIVAGVDGDGGGGTGVDHGVVARAGYAAGAPVRGVVPVAAAGVGPRHGTREGADLELLQGKGQTLAVPG